MYAWQYILLLTFVCYVINCVFYMFNGIGIFIWSYSILFAILLSRRNKYQKNKRFQFNSYKWIQKKKKRRKCSNETNILSIKCQKWTLQVIWIGFIFTEIQRNDIRIASHWILNRKTSFTWFRKFMLLNAHSYW